MCIMKVKQLIFSNLSIFYIYYILKTGEMTTFHIFSEYLLCWAKLNIPLGENTYEKNFS